MTKHTSSCSRVFKNYDPTCPRCQELAQGASPREGWQTKHFALKAQQDRVRELSIDAHFAPNGPHAKGLCGPVCTFGDW